MIHDAGLVHTKICKENILVKDGVPIIVDFKRARPHPCHRVNAIVPGAVKPPLEDVGCVYIYRLVQEMCIWVPGKSRSLSFEASLERLNGYHPAAIINFVDTCVAVEDIRSVEQLAEMAYSSSTDTEEDRRYILQEACQTFDILSEGHCLFNPDPQPPRGRSRSIRRLSD